MGSDNIKAVGWPESRKMSANAENPTQGAVFHLIRMPNLFYSQPFNMRAIKPAGKKTKKNSCCFAEQ